MGWMERTEEGLRQEGWLDVMDDMRRLGCPVREWVCIGGGLIVLEVPAEHPTDYVWLGGWDWWDWDDDGNWVGPWLTCPVADLVAVGGYRWWAEEAYGDFFYSDRVERALEAPGQDAAEALVEVWRALRAAPTPHPV